MLATVLIALCFMPATLIAKTVTIGMGVASWGYPLVTYYHDARTQTIYLASEIGMPMEINSMALYVATIPGQTMNNFILTNGTHRF